jgi:hypothetical protein
MVLGILPSFVFVLETDPGSILVQVDPPKGKFRGFDKVLGDFAEFLSESLVIECRPANFSFAIDEDEPKTVVIYFGCVPEGVITLWKPSRAYQRPSEQRLFEVLFVRSHPLIRFLLSNDRARGLDSSGQ